MVKFVILIVLAFLTPSVHAQVVVKEVVRFEPTRRLLLLPEKFVPFGKGFQLQDEVFHCDNGSDTKAARGAMQTVALNQTKPEPFRVELSSKAENVSGVASGHDYSLYIDIIYTDGTPLWGQTVPFETGTHDWETKAITIHPEKPIKYLMLHAIFRNKSGKAAFREMKLQMLSAPDGTTLFDGVPVVQKKKAALQIRDVTANSDYVELQGNPFGIVPTVKTNDAFTTVTLTNSDHKDRCFTLVYAIDVSGKELLWCENPRTNVPVKPETEYMQASSMPGIGGGRLSLYPFAAVASDTKGSAIGIDVRHTPAFFRTGYHSGTSELFVAVDLALTKESPTATINFVHFSFPPKHTFRGSLDAYYRLFPDGFTNRVRDKGIWMPFAAISKVPNHEDFGFMIKEGNDETAWDDAHGVLTFRYTEPGTWWMPIPDNLPQTYESAMDQAKKLASENNPHALALFKSGMHDEKGKLVCQILDTPWCKGAVWSMNDMPEIEGGSFATKWNSQIYKSNYEDKSKGVLDGEYVDSSEAYVTAPLDFSRQNFSAARTPLTFSTVPSPSGGGLEGGQDHRPVIFKGLVMYEYVRKIAEDMLEHSKLTMANSTPDRLCWLTPWLDVLGTEIDWNHSGKWQPMSDINMLYRRALCGTKPFCFLMNTDFSKFSYDHSERFMQRCLAYGMFPGYFSADASTGHYFAQPELYDRDRPLFKKYVPLCKLVAEAGWQPITFAVSSEPKVYVERFGNEEKRMFYTVFNDAQESKTAAIRFEKQYTMFKDLVSGESIVVVDGKTQITLLPEGIAVLEPVE